MDRFKVGIIGADTPEGAQLVRLLMRHPVVELVAISSSGAAGRTLGEVCPSLRGICSQTLVSDQRVIEEADVVFGADPTLDGQELAARCIKDKDVYLDLSPAFRLYSEEVYAQWFGGGFDYPGLHEAAIYGLPELMRDQMPGKVLIGLPGATATAALLALAPLLAEGLVQPDAITISSLMPTQTCGEYAAANGGSCAFAPGAFTETAEIEQLLGDAAERQVHVLLTPHSVPAVRGVLVTCMARAALAANQKTIRAALERYYGGERFIRLLPDGCRADTGAVLGSNLCDISATFDERTGGVVVSAALDGLMKGSAGQAVQCMNRILSMPEHIALEDPPVM